jgi:MFS family permease
LSKLAPIAAVLISVFLLISGNALVGVVVPVRGSLDGFGELIVGLLGSAYFGGMLAGAALTPAMVRRAGHIRAFSAFVAVGVVATVLLPAAITPIAWLISRAVVGFVLAGIYSIVESWINGAATNANRGALYAVYQTVSWGATAVGQLFMRGLDPRGFLPYSVGAALYGLAIVPLAMTNAEAPELPRSVRVRWSSVKRLSAVAALAGLVAGICNGATLSLAPVYALQIGVEPERAPYFTASIMFGTALGVYPIGWLSDRMDRRVITALAMAVGASFEIALAWLNPTGAPLIGLGFLVGLTTYTLYTLAAAIANDGAAAHEMVLISATLLFVYCVGAIVSPAVASLAMRAYGPGALFWLTAAVHAALAGYVGWELLGHGAPAALSSPRH